MADKLLFAVDFSPYTEKLVGCAGELAQVGLNDVTLLYVLESKKHADYGDHKNPAFEAEAEKAQAHLSELAGQLEEEGLAVTPAFKSGDPAQLIVDTAAEQNVDLIFMGAKGKGRLDRAFLGSVSDKVLRLADRSVMIQHCRVKKGEGGYSCENACTSLFGNILIANDFSKYADRVRPLVTDLAKTLCTPMTLLHVEEGKEDGGWQVVDQAKKEKVKSKMEMLQEMSYELGDFCKSVRVDVVNGSPPSAILAYAEEIDASMIVLGAFGHRDIEPEKLGSVTEKIVHKSDRPVMVLKPRT